MQPSVDQTELDGALGVLPPSSGKLYALAGVSSSGPIATPATYARVADVVADFGSGPLVEAACHYIEKYGKPVLLVRTTATTAGAYLDAVEAEDGAISAITKTGTGTSVFTDNDSDPLVAADVKVLFAVGGTRGTAGIVYQISLDGGNTWGPPLALGTDVTFAVGATGASIAVGAGTIVAGDFIEFTLTAPIEASAGEVVHSGLQNAPTLDETTHPDDDYEVKILFVAGGTRGVAGITYRWSLDGGRTYSALTALGTATSIIVPQSGGVKIDLGAGTIAAGATIAFPTVAPKWNTTDLGVALDALRDTAAIWELVHVVGPCDAVEAAAIDLKLTAMAALGKMHGFLCSARLPVGAESEATYFASLSADFADFATTFGAVCAGAIQTVSSVSGRQYRRPLAFTAAAREASVSQQIDTADVNLGPLPVTRIRDSNGNPLHHDESVNPGLDDARFYVARTWEGYAGVYVNRPRLFSVEGSDFKLVPHRRVMNVAREVSRARLTRRLNRPIPVNPVTGFILERAAQEIEADVRGALEAALLATPTKASGVSWVLSRTDNLLSTATLNAQHRIVPLAYIETIQEEVAFENPALRVTAA